VRIQRGSDGTPVGGAIALALARVRLLVADAYRLGRRGEADAGRDAARRLLADAMVDLELALKSVADAGRLEVGQRYASDRAATLRATILDLPRDASPEFAAGWRSGLLVAAERGFDAGSPELAALERLARASCTECRPRGDSARS
jgi:hypothetical protein